MRAFLCRIKYKTDGFGISTQSFKGWEILLASMIPVAQRKHKEFFFFLSSGSLVLGDVNERNRMQERDVVEAAWSSPWLSTPVHISNRSSERWGWHGNNSVHIITSLVPLQEFPCHEITQWLRAPRSVPWQLWVNLECDFMLMLFFCLCCLWFLKNYEFLIICSYFAYYLNSIGTWTLSFMYLLILTRQNFCLLKCTFSSLYRAVCVREDSWIVATYLCQKKINVYLP